MCTFLLVGAEYKLTAGDVVYFNPTPNFFYVYFYSRQNQLRIRKSDGEVVHQFRFPAETDYDTMKEFISLLTGMPLADKEVRNNQLTLG